jgi:hypothetical protein
MKDKTNNVLAILLIAFLMIFSLFVLIAPPGVWAVLFFCLFSLIILAVVGSCIYFVKTSKERVAALGRMVQRYEDCTKDSENARKKLKSAIEVSRLILVITQRDLKRRHFVSAFLLASSTCHDLNDSIIKLSREEPFFSSLVAREF